MDALDRVSSRKMSKEQKKEYAIKKKEEEEKTIFTNKKEVERASKAFRDKVAAERRRLGLDVINHKSVTDCCKKCFRMKCVCE